MGGPTYMTDSQIGDYLQNLRANRPARPAGSRPAPASTTTHKSSGSGNRRSMIEDMRRDSTGPRTSADEQPSRSSSTLSYYYDSGSSGTSSKRHSLPRHVASDPRIMERRESRALRLAMEGLDAGRDKDGADVYSNAKDEVDELLREHQKPTKTVVSDEQQQRQDSFDLDNLLDDYGQEPTLHRDKYNVSPAAPRVQPGRSKHQSNSSEELDPEVAVRKMSSRGWLSRKMHEQSDDDDEAQDVSIARKLSQKLSFNSLAGRRKSGGRKSTGRNVSGGGFPNETSKIYEDPSDAEPPKAADEDAKAAAIRRNPFQRYHSTKESVSADAPARPRHRQEIWKNDPTQSRNPGYTRNAVSPTESTPPERRPSDSKLRNGVEVRSDDIRAATSKRMGDRSTRLPSPTAVGDRSRPIVSFDPNWKPPARDESAARPLGARPLSPTKPGVKATGPVADYPSIYKLLGEEEPEIKGVDRVVSAEGVQRSQSHSPPVSPTIAIDAPPTPQRPVKVPQINVDEGAASSVPSINVSEPTPEKSKPTVAATSRATQARNLFTPMHTRRAGLCAQCALPISGRIVTAAGTRFHPECFKCFHCSEALECVAFYPEPAEKRQERLDRASRGEHQGPDGDDDDSLRFYCHLDYHEFFSPRCKSCKTPIEGEVVVACGAEWHVGHFFCAQCGDPFDPSKPFVEKDGYAWCVKCHTHRYSTKCRKCRKPVTDTVIKALGAEWHQGCFCCGECGAAFDDGRYFLRLADGDEVGGVPKDKDAMVVCFSCEDRRLKA